MYVIYTSGSTGQPKGVMLEHRQVSDFLSGLYEALGCEAVRTVAGITNVTFDISVLEIFGALCFGRRLVLLGEEALDPDSMIAYLHQEQVELLQLTPSRLSQISDWLFQAELPHFRHLLVGGEAFPRQLFERKQALAHLNIVNVYGPTETTIWSTALRLSESDTLSIGTPLHNEEVLILNPSGELQAEGVRGEICIGGAGLARGYQGRPDLTAERFITHPWKEGERLYKTGDLGKWLPSGHIQFLGRNDNQVKIRGHRIETGEIETVLLSYEAEFRQVVVVPKIQNEESLLAAYYSSSTAIDKAALRLHLQAHLPAYMIPTYFIEMDELPLNSSGKIDVKSLPEISESDIFRRVFIAPETELEQALNGLWSAVLGLQKISVEDNFFEIGGNSILVVRLFSKIKASLCASLKITDLFTHTTIRSQADFIAEKDRENTAVLEVNEIDF